ncbi:MAG: hemerythrin domain-containing protein, partial [Alphaproteobacteria bacterium]
MAYITWDPAHETGIPGIDYEHRRLVELLNDIHDLIAARAEPLTIADRLADLYTLATAHFALEEKVMREQKYAGLAERR